MACPIIRLSNAAQNKLHRVIQVCDCVSLVILLVILFEAIHFSKNTGYYIKMVSFIDGIILPVLISLVALLALPVHLGGVFLYYKLRNADQVDHRVIQWLYYFVIATLLIAILILCVIITTVVHTRSLEHGLHNGISENIKSYIMGGEASKNMDLLQINFQCCGSKSYKEWFYVRWDYLMPDQCTPGTAVSDDVPFSCCLQKAMRPCVHNHMTAASHVYLYDPYIRVDVSTVGCHRVLIARAQSMAAKTSLWLTLLLLWEIILLIAKRFQQTSLSGKTDGKYGTMKHEAWLFGSSPSPYADSRHTDEDSQALLKEEGSSSSKTNSK